MGATEKPGLYVAEQNVVPSVVEVATAVPAFIGHTAVAGKRNMRKPVRIASLAEYEHVFGVGPKPLFMIAEKKDTSILADFTAGHKQYLLKQLAGKNGGRFTLYNGVRHFFQNGGGPCWIVSVGDYADELDPDAFKRGLDSLLNEQEPTMLVIPEAVLFPQAVCLDLQQAMLVHCGEKTRNRVAILDVWGGDKLRKEQAGDPINLFRTGLGNTGLSFAAAYYPWLNTTVVDARELSYENISNPEVLMELLRADLGLPAELSPDASQIQKDKFQAVADIKKDWSTTPPDKVIDGKALVHGTLMRISPLYQTILKIVQSQLNLLPASSAMAGVYTLVDGTRGVWKAPANLPLSGVISPAVALSASEQDDLSSGAQGKPINIIRDFAGQGIRVWGAHTLDSDNPEWRYINVRRMVIMIEESCRRAMQALVFERNDSGTWAVVKSMTQTFLMGIWKRGGLAGAVPEEAFSVHVGLGDTMTAQDILDGLLRVTILVAMVRPAEFIGTSIQQQMQKP